MSTLFKTNLSIVSAQLPPDFKGTPTEFQKALVERLEILSPVGTNFFVVGDVEPPNDQGPWLKDGRSWYVFDTNLGYYVPADITSSTLSLFTVSDTTPVNPSTGDAVIWLRTKSNRVLGWYYWDGATWRPDGNTPPSGTTSQRPSDPNELEQFFDTTCGALIHWERGSWRTVSGTPGDVKFVTFSLLADALTYNPGWEYLGETDSTVRGRVLGVASRDTGATPASSYSTDSGISARASDSLAGVETVLLSDLEIPQHTHLIGIQNGLGVHTVQLYRCFNGDDIVAPGAKPPEYSKSSTNWTSTNSAMADAATGCAFVTSTQLSESAHPNYTTPATAHTNIQPTKFLWALTKT